MKFPAYFVFQGMPFPSRFIFIEAIYHKKSDLMKYLKATGKMRGVAVVTVYEPRRSAPRPKREARG